MDSNIDLKTYIERIENLRQRKNAALHDDDLREITRDLGWTDAELAELEQQVQAHLKRAENYLAHKLVDNAIAELNEAIALAPTRLPALSSLANAHYERFKVSKAVSDLDRAEKGARICLELDPGHHTSYALLAEIQRLRTSQNLAPAAGTKTKPNLAPFVAIGVAMVLFLTGLVVTFLVAAPVEQSTPIIVHHDPPASPADPTLTPAVSAPADIQLTLEAPPDLNLRLEARKIEQNEYDDSAFFSFAVLLHNDGSKQFQKIKGRFELFDASGQTLVVYPTTLLDTHHGQLRPGDTLQANSLFSSKHGVKSAKLTLEKTEHVQAPNAYPEPKKINLVWDIPKPPSVELDVLERRIKFDDPQSATAGLAFFQSEWTIKNSGSATLQSLKFEIRLYDKANALIESQELLTVYSSSPDFRPGESRVEFAIKQIKSPFDRYELHVTEAE